MKIFLPLQMNKLMTSLPKEGHAILLLKRKFNDPNGK
jgi:hypothetical protein